jgi:hypothetical protein
MGGLFSKPKPMAPPPPPTVDSAAVNTAATAERLRRQKASGRESTILSGNLGATTDAASSTQRSTLLGG